MPYIIKNGLTYTGNLIPITQAQYEALSEAEKNNGIAYFIVDSDAVLDASDVGLGEGNVEDLAGSVAVIETSPATAIHAVGDSILWNGQFYTVTSAIAVGEDLTVGSNITATSVGSELTSLKAGLTSLIKKVTYSGTTDSSGNIGAGSTSSRIMLSAVPDRTVNADLSSALITTTAAGTNYMLHCIKSDGTILTNANVTVVCVYVDGSLF